MKYTIKDFLAGKVDVRCVNDEQKKAFLKACAKHGLLWHHGDKADAFMPMFNVISMKAFNDGRLGHHWRQIADACVDFDEIDLSSAHRYQIVIESDGDTTTAKMVVNGKEVKTATAKRNPADKANWRTGAQVAFDRLWQKQEKPKKPAEKDGFKVGDRVVINDPDGRCAHDAHGKHGTIVSTDDEVCGISWICVELDEAVYHHDCGGKTKHGHGCYVYAEQLVHEQPTKQTVREVKRRAKAGEWVKIVGATGLPDEEYQDGDILQVIKNSFTLDYLSCGGGGANKSEYVVLEGYQPGRDA